MIKFLKDFNSPDYVDRVMCGEAISVLDIMHDPKEAFKNCRIPNNIDDLNTLCSLCWDRRNESIQARIKTIFTFGRKKYRQVPHYDYVISMCLAYVNYSICLSAAKQNDWKPYIDVKSLIGFPSRFWYMVWFFGSKKYISMMNDKTFRRKCSDHWRCSPQYYNLCVWGDTVFAWKLKKRIARIDKEFAQLAPGMQTSKENSIPLEEIDYNGLLQNELFKKYLKQIPESIYKPETDTWDCPKTWIYVLFDAIKFYCQMENPKFLYVDVRGACAKRFRCSKENIKVSVSQKLSGKTFGQSDAFWNLLNNLFPEYVMKNCPGNTVARQEKED